MLEAFRAVEQRDEQRLRRLCHPEITFHWPPSLPFGASHSGVDLSWSAVWDRVQPTDVERRMDPRVIAATEREVVVLWRQRGLGPQGTSYDGEVLGLYEVRDGKLARAQMFYFDAVAVQRFLALSGADPDQAAAAGASIRDPTSSAREKRMPFVALPAGTIEYQDIGAGPAVVLVHSLTMDGAQWRHVVAELRSDFRCILPTLPMGAHRRPMRPDADLSLRGMGRVLADFIAALDLESVALCFNDWCGAQVMIADGLMIRVERLVLVSCEAFDNYPPGLPGWMAARAAELPGAAAAMARALRVRRLRQLPIALGWLSKRGVPDDVVDEWLRPLRRREIRRDFRKYAADTRRGRRDLLAATEALTSFDRPVLIVWATEDRVMPPAHGRRLAGLFPNSRLIEVADSYTLIPKTSPPCSPPTCADSSPSPRPGPPSAPTRDEAETQERTPLGGSQACIGTGARVRAHEDNDPACA